MAAEFTAARGLNVRVADAIAAPVITRVARELEGHARDYAPAIKTWHCLLPGTPIAATGVTHAARRRYEGPAVRLTTASGASFAATPEHEVLTGRGWICAKLVREGDDLFKVAGSEPAGTPHVQDPPALIGQVVDAAWNRATPEVRAVHRSVDLNGYSAGGGDVDVVPADGCLRTGVKARFLERAEDLVLTDADVLVAALKLGDRHRRELRLWHGVTHEARTDFGPVRVALLEGLSRYPHDPRCALAAPRHAALTQQPRYDDLRAIVPRGNGAGGHPRQVVGDHRVTVNVGPAANLVGRQPRLLDLRLPLGALRGPARRFGGWEEFTGGAKAAGDCGEAGADGGGNLALSIAAAVTRDQVIKVQVLRYSGHVYDLSTESHWFAADGLIVHNSMGDALVRRQHRAGDGQEQPANLRFGIPSFDWDIQHRGLTGTTWLLEPRDESSRAYVNLVHCRCRAAYDPQGMARRIDAEPTVVLGARVSATVTSAHPRSVAAEVGESYPLGLVSPGVHFMARALATTAAESRARLG